MSDAITLYRCCSMCDWIIFLLCHIGVLEFKSPVRIVLICVFSSESRSEQRRGLFGLL